MRRRVLVSSFYNRQAVQPALATLAQRTEVILCTEGRRLSEHELIAHLDGIDAVLATDEPYSERVFAERPRLRMVALDGTGFDSVDLAAATQHGVIVNNAPVNYDAVADLAFGLMIVVMRKIAIGDRGVREGRWWDRDTYLSNDVNRAILGIIGFGRVGRAMAKRASGFGMSVLAYSRHIEPAVAQQFGAHAVDWDELLSTSDVISIHVPLTNDTRDLIGREQFDMMKDGAYLINTSRGEVIDETALLAALGSGKLAGAGLDVLRSEPPTLVNPLLKLGNVVFTAHVGGDTRGAFLRIYESAVTDILLYFDGKRPRNIVNPDVLHHEHFVDLL